MWHSHVRKHWSIYCLQVLTDWWPRPSFLPCYIKDTWPARTINTQELQTYHHFPKMNLKSDSVERYIPELWMSLSRWIWWQVLSNTFFSNRKRTSLVKGSDTARKRSLHVSLNPHSIIQEDADYTVYHRDKRVPLALFINLDSNSNMLSGSVSERLIYRRKGLWFDMRYC